MSGLIVRTWRASGAGSDPSANTLAVITVTASGDRSGPHPITASNGDTVNR